MGTTGCPDPRIDRSPSCCCSPFECQLCCQSSNSSPAVASSISRGRNHAVDRSPAVPQDRARRSLRASRRAAILRDWPAEILWGERRENGIIVAATQPTGCPMPRPKDLSRSLAALDENSTLIAVIEMSQSSWLVAATIPGVERQPTKKLTPDEGGLLRLLHRWRGEAEKAGRTISRIAVAYEAGRDGFWLARWLRAHGIEAHVIHPNSIAVSREHRRAKTDRLDTALLKRAFLGWLRGERGHCSMAAIPSLKEEDAKRPGRERENLVGERTRVGNRIKSALARIGIRGFKPSLRSRATARGAAHAGGTTGAAPHTGRARARD